MMIKKTLLITSIYTKLWGTELGGRCGREWHYKQSLLNILNLSPTKCICFTSTEEYDDLVTYFYETNQISKDILELRVFNLGDTKYFKKLRKKKNIDEMKTIDRCYEIQYNKFFWFDLIEDRFEYDRVYWIDAGLSYNGLFPEEFITDVSIHGSYKVNLFTPKLLHNINKKTEDKIFILAKNNTDRFHWSKTVPEQYYNEFDMSLHIIGGMFGGTPQMYELMRNNFEELLLKLIKNERSLYMEELIMSCLYYNNKDLYTTEFFDDWYKRSPDETGVRYFYHIFVKLLKTNKK